MKWEAFADGIKNFFNTNFKTDIGEDDSPAEILDKIEGVQIRSEQNEVVDNSDEISSLQQQLASMNDSIEELKASLIALENIQTSLKEDQDAAIETMTEIDSRVTDLAASVNKSKMTSSSSGRSSQDVVKSASQETKRESTGKNVAEISLKDILSGPIKN